MVRTLASLFVALALGLAAPRLAQAQNPLIERGIGEYDEVRFEEALQTL